MEKVFIFRTFNFCVTNIYSKPSVDHFYCRLQNNKQVTDQYNKFTLLRIPRSC